MATYYISAVIDNEEVVFAMNATESMSVTSTGDLSTHRLENADFASDNYRNNPDTMNIRGIISDVFVGSDISESDRKTTREYIEGLERIKNSRIPFTVHVASELTPRYPCFFTQLNYSQTPEFGFSGTKEDGSGVNAFKVSMKIMQTRIGKSSTITTGRASEFVDPTQEKQESSSSTKAVTGDEGIVAGLVQRATGATQSLEAGSGVDLPGGS